MSETNYTIKYGKHTNIVYEGGTVIAKTAASVPDSAKRALWVCKGCIPTHWYEEIDGKIYLKVTEEE